MFHLFSKSGKEHRNEAVYPIEMARLKIKIDF